MNEEEQILRLLAMLEDTAWSSTLRSLVSGSRVLRDSLSGSEIGMIVLVLEGRLGVDLPSALVESLETLGDLAYYVDRLTMP